MGRLFAFFVMGLAATAAVAAPPSPYKSEFAAEQVQVSPDGQRNVVQKMFIGDQKLRFEMIPVAAQGQPNGGSVVIVVDTAAKRGWRLFPEQSMYMEMPVPPEMKDAPAAAGDDDSPCAGHPRMSCVKQGVEDVNGRKALKWEMSGGARQGQPVRFTQWIDVERHFPVKSEMPNGAKFEAKLVGTETVNGRSAEKWENTTTEQGNTQTTLVWFDPELNTAIRQQFPNGAVVELTNIQEGAQPAALFTIPAGYHETAPPQMPRGQGGPMSGGQMPQRGQMPPAGMQQR